MADRGILELAHHLSLALIWVTVAEFDAVLVIGDFEHLHGHRNHAALLLGFVSKVSLELKTKFTARDPCTDLLLLKLLVQVLEEIEWIARREELRLAVLVHRPVLLNRVVLPGFLLR